MALLWSSVESRVDLHLVELIVLHQACNSLFKVMDGQLADWNQEGCNVLDILVRKDVEEHLWDDLLELISLDHAVVVNVNGQ